MSDWNDCDALKLLSEPIDMPDMDPDAPPWLWELAVAAHDLAHAAATMQWPEIVITCRLWLRGDENRLLPMPLRYAATHPQSPQAILGVLSGGAR